MNYYIDFDNTLYNTPLLANLMLDKLAECIVSQKKYDKESILNECKSMFNREHIYDIYELIEYFTNKYTLDPKPIEDNVNKVILNGSNLVFEDSIPFLEKLQSQGHNIFLL